MVKNMKHIIEIETGTRQLLSHIHGNIGIITLNRPESKNALSDELTPALRQQISKFNIDKRVNSLIITGAGDAFCAGGDVKSMNLSKNNQLIARVVRYKSHDHLPIKKRKVEIYEWICEKNNYMKH